MKTRPQTILCALVFALLMLAQSASAFYDASLGRWINRDPIGEEWFRMIRSKGKDINGYRNTLGEVAEGPNLYAFVVNDGVNFYDDFGNGKRPARNRDRVGHGECGQETKGGGKGDKHSRAQGHGGREKPNFKRAPGRGPRCGMIGVAAWCALEQINDELPYEEVIPPDDECPSRTQRKVEHCLLWWCYTTCEPPLY